MSLRTIAFLSLACAFTPAAAQVTLTEGPVVIPTYLAGAPDKNPMFYTGRTYQGAKGMVYPYAMQDTLTDVKENKTYTQVCLENEYVKVCVLPELGGRIFEAVDKTNGYNFFYKQNVIKPALIGMLGAWISGGVEWNIPHHHRATSFMPVLYRKHDNPDGSKSVTVGEMELRDRLRWAITLTLRPGSSVLEARVAALNPNPVQNSLLYFANVAVHTNNDYQIIFPPATHFATQHAKREFVRWPIADTVYNGIDFTRGVDVSWWKNHPSSVSMFAWNDTDDWLAGYDHGKNAGTLHVANRHQVPGKKFFTWGTGPGGRLWDKILSDTDGPYLELMVGAWSDNQPDYSWLQPYETKTVTQYWYPFQAIGGAKNATREAAVNLELKNGEAAFGFHTTRAYKLARASLAADGKTIWTRNIDIDPAHPFTSRFNLPRGAAKIEAILQANGRTLVSYVAQAPAPPAGGHTAQPLPAPVVPPAEPAKIKTTEDLYLAGLRLEQFHNPSLEPDPYYEEALKRDPTDIRNNTALGILYIKRGRFASAEKLLRTAAGHVQANYTRARDGDSLYYLGVALKYQHKLDEAESWLQRAAWNHAWKAAAYYQIAEIKSLQDKLDEALSYADQSLVTNAWNTRALFLKSALLMRNGQGSEAAAVRRQIRAIDPIDPRGFADASELAAIAKAQPDEGLELAVSCINAGLRREAEFLLDRMPVKSPMVHYFRGYLTALHGQSTTAEAHFQRASAMPPDYVFPFQIEAIDALRAAMDANPKDPMPPYYLGLLLYDRQPDEAVRLWQKTVDLKPEMAVAWRNLAVAWARQENGVPKAIGALEKAIAQNSGDALYLFELDRLYEFAQVPLAKRTALFDKYAKTAEKRDDAMSRVVTLYNLTGNYDASIAILSQRHFHLWEGGARFNVQDAWTDAHILRGHRKMAAKDFAGALADYRQSTDYPENIEATRGFRGGRYAEAYYFTGLALEALGRKDEAAQQFRASAAALLGAEDNPRPDIESGAALLYFQAKSLEKLGQTARAQVLYKNLIATATRALQGGTRNQFFAKFGEARSPRLRAAQAHYVAGLGHLGLKSTAQARSEFTKAIELNPYLLEARSRIQDLQ
jgi:tetratricopeptide (TPR) repeat protein